MKIRLVFIGGIAAGMLLGLAGCSTPKIWPFYKKPKPVPEAVNEIILVNPDGSAASYPQYWKRNTLVIDLTGASGQGGVTARLPEETTWPVRLAVRVQPGAVGQLEVQAEERNILPVTDQGTKVVDLELAPSLYTPNTAAIYISWAPTPVFADTAQAEAAPEFVSPTEVPKSSTDASLSEEPQASDIVAPADAAAQPSPPPGN